MNLPLIIFWFIGLVFVIYYYTFLSMIEVPLYPNGYPCKCSVNCNYSKAYKDAGKPKYIDYENLYKKRFYTRVKKPGTH